MGASADEVLLKIRAEGWKAAAKTIKDTEKAIRDAKKAADKRPTGGPNSSWIGSLGLHLRALPAKWKAGEAGATQFRRSLSGIGSDALGLTRTLAGTGAKIAGLGGLGGGALLGSQVFGGLGDNEKFQDARTSFTTFLGDAEKANAFVEKLRANVSNGSPFKLTDIFGNARQLLGFNLTAGQTVKTLESVKAAALASGSGAAGFDRISLALGQIAAKGKLSAEEMLQLAEAGVPVQQIIRDTFKLTDKQMADIGNVNIPANAALWAITEGPNGWDSRFAEAAKNAKANASNQRAQISKNWEQLRRMATEPLFEKLNQDVYPQVSNALDNAVKTFGRDDLSFDAKVKIAWDGVKDDLGPLWSEIDDGIASLHLDTKLQDAAVAGLNLAVKGAVAAAPKLASAFWDAFWDASVTGKLLAVGFLWNRLRIPFWPIAGKLAGVLWTAGKVPFAWAGARLGQTAGAQAAKAAAETAAIRSMLLGDAIKGTASNGMSVAGAALGTTLGAALASSAIVAAGGAFGDWVDGQLRGDDGKTAEDRVLGRPGRQHGSFFKDPLGATKDAVANGPIGDLGRGIGGVLGGGKKDGESELDRMKRLDEERKKALGEQMMKRGLNIERFRPRATGGTVRPGELTLVGERGPEPARFPAGTQITSNRQARVQAAGARSPRVLERVVREQPITLMLDGHAFYKAMSRQTELVELRG